MTDIDIVADLRRLWEAAPQGKWTLEPYADFTGRVIGYDIQQIGPNGGDVIEVAKREDADLIVAMHEALPALLDAVEALRWYADAGNYHDPTDVPDHLYRDSGDVLLIRGGGGQRARAALAALERCRVSDVLAEVAQERDRQDAKWGQQNHSPAGWLAVLVEEVGEAAQQIAQGWVEPITGGQCDYPANLRRELIQVAASAVAFIECLDRQDGAS